MPRHARDDAAVRRRRRAVLASCAVALGAAMGAAYAAGMLPSGDDGARGTPAAPLEAGQGSEGGGAGTASPSPSPEPTPEPAVFTIVATGDVLPHNPVIRSASTGGAPDFSPLLAGTDPWVRGADLALCHMEVPVAPPGERVTTYPMFGAPAEIVRDLAEQGWDGCSTASNHSVDRGYAGVVATLDAFDAAGLGHVGTARSTEEQALPQTYTLQRAGRSLDVAHLAATYGLNGLPVPAEAPWAVDLIDVDRMVAQASAARAAGAELVVLSLHFGVEYHIEPTPEQVDIATRVAASGQVDVAIGHHAHVPQEVALLPGGPEGAGMWVAYGLGNYLSNQNPQCCAASANVGELLTVTVTQEPEAPTRVTAVEWTGITVDRAAGHRVRVLPEAVADPGGGTLSVAELEDRYERVRSAAGAQAPERAAPPVPTGPEPNVVPRTPAPG